MTFLDDFITIIAKFDKILTQIQVICVILLLLVGYSWVVSMPEPGTEMYYILLIDLFIVGVPFAGVTLLRKVGAQQNRVT